MIRVLLVDDHALVRTGLKRVLEEAPDIHVVAEAGNGWEAIEQYRTTEPAVVVMDISMPQMDGLEATKQLRSVYRDARILVLTMHTEEDYALRMLRAGCLGYVTKGTSTSELHNAVRTVGQGRRFLSAAGKDILTWKLLSDKKDVGLVECLSDRELQVLCLIASGRKVTEIADELSLGIKTIQTYRTRVLRKLQLRTNADIARFAVGNGLIVGRTRPANGCWLSA